MKAAPNLFDPEFDYEMDEEAFSHRRAKLAAQAGSERLGASLYELDPGKAAFPLHYHLGNEELLIALSGTATLRTPDGERELVEGEVVAFPVGEAGAHQVVNRGDAQVRILVVSEMNSPEIVIRPESGKLSAFGRPPGTSDDRGMHDVYYQRDSNSILEGEEPPPEAPE